MREIIFLEQKNVVSVDHGNLVNRIVHLFFYYEILIKSNSFFGM